MIDSSSSMSTSAPVSSRRQSVLICVDGSGRRGRRRPREEVALEGVEPELAAALGLLVGLDLLGDQPQPAGLEHRRVVGELLGRERAHVELDDRRELEQRLLLGRVVEVVQRDRETGVDQVAQRLQQGVVELLVLEQLEHDPLRARTAATARRAGTRA